MSQRYRDEDFDAVVEPWITVTTKSGLRLRIRNSVVRIRRVIDEEGKQLFSPDGSIPQVLVDGQLQVVVLTDEENIAGSSQPF